MSWLLRRMRFPPGSCGVGSVSGGKKHAFVIGTIFPPVIYRPVDHAGPDSTRLDTLSA